MIAQILRRIASPRGLLLLFLPAIGVFLALGLFAQPSTDDFVYAVQARELGVAGFVAHVYRTWCGRYFSMSVQGWFSQFDLVTLYPLVPLIVVSGLLLAIGWCLKNLLACVGRPITSRQAAWWAIALGAIYLTQMPSVCEGLYWLSSVTVYLLPLTVALLMFAVGLGTRGGFEVFGFQFSDSTSPSENRKPKTENLPALRAALCGVLAFCVAGSSETLLPAVGLLLLIAAGLAWRRRHPSFLVWCVALAAVATGGLILVLAPGNAVRAACFDKLPLGNRLLMGFVGGPELLAKWSLRPVLLGGSVLMLPRLARWFAQPGGRIIGKHVALVAGATAAIVCVGYLLPCLAVGQKPPRRVLNVLFFFFLVGWSTALTLAAVWLRRAAPRFVKPSRRQRTLAAAALIVGLFAVGHLPRAVYDMVWLAPQYRQELTARWDKLAQAKESAEIEPLSVRPPSLCFADLCDEPSQATYYARYFGLGEVRYSRVCPTK